jgi:hypothetical protein
VLLNYCPSVQDVPSLTSALPLVSEGLLHATLFSSMDMLRRVECKHDLFYMHLINRIKKAVSWIINEDLVTEIPGCIALYAVAPAMVVHSLDQSNIESLSYDTPLRNGFFQRKEFYDVISSLSNFNGASSLSLLRTSEAMDELSSGIAACYREIKDAFTFLKLWYIE